VCPTLKNKLWPPLCQNNVNGVYIIYVMKNTKLRQSAKEKKRLDQFIEADM
jgi:hypothetical protein